MKNLILLSCLLFPLITWSQTVPIKGEQVPISYSQPTTQGGSTNPDGTDSPLSSQFQSDETIGTSLYDYQTNASIMNRLVNYGDNRLSAVWTMSQNEAGFPDRGTGYNHFDGNSWGELPQNRIETVRTGWPSIIVTEDETELIVSHDFAQNTLVTSRRAVGEEDWTQGTIPTQVPMGQLWPQMAVGDGDNVHLIAITGLGESYEGVEGHLLYYRSSDAGLTWEVQDFIIPGLDSTNYRSYRQTDSYKIAANGNTVAIARFTFWEDVLVFRSDDNGDSWDKSVIYDFPIDNYVPDSGYDESQVPPDDFAPSNLAIYSAGNNGNLIIDHNDNLHLFFNSLYVTDVNLTNQVLEYFPCSNGIVYWNESMGENSFRLIASVIDANNSGFLEFDCVTPNFSHRNAGLVTAPNAGIDANNNIYLTYSAMTENYYSAGANPSFQHYQHIYAIASQDGGDTWTAPIDLIEETVDPSILDMVNADFPTVALKVDDQMHLFYQQDFEPGTNFVDSDPIAENRMVYIGMDISTFGIVSDHDLVETEKRLILSPNPAHNQCYLQINPDWDSGARLTIYDTQGRQIYKEGSSNWTKEARYQLPIADLPKGIFSVQVQDKKGTYLGKLVIE